LIQKKVKKNEARERGQSLDARGVRAKDHQKEKELWEDGYAVKAGIQDSEDL